MKICPTLYGFWKPRNGFEVENVPVGEFIKVNTDSLLKEVCPHPRHHFFIGGKEELANVRCQFLPKAMVQRGIDEAEVENLIAINQEIIEESLNEKNWGERFAAITLWHYVFMMTRAKIQDCLYKPQDLFAFEASKSKQTLRTDDAIFVAHLCMAVILRMLQRQPIPIDLSKKLLLMKAAEYVGCRDPADVIYETRLNSRIFTSNPTLN